jgi:hypothetical protein
VSVESSRPKGHTRTPEQRTRRAHYAGRLWPWDVSSTRWSECDWAATFRETPFANCWLIMPSTAAGNSPGCVATAMAPATHGSVAKLFGCAAVAHNSPLAVAASSPGSVWSARDIIERRCDLSGQSLVFHSDRRGQLTSRSSAEQGSGDSRRIAHP